MSLATEEILASLLGSLIAPDVADQETLVLKALAETLDRGMASEDAQRVVGQLRSYLEKLL